MRSKQQPRPSYRWSKAKTSDEPAATAAVDKHAAKEQSVSQPICNHLDKLETLNLAQETCASKKVDQITPDSNQHCQTRRKMSIALISSAKNISAIEPPLGARYPRGEYFGKPPVTMLPLSATQLTIPSTTTTHDHAISAEVPEEELTTKTPTPTLVTTKPKIHQTIKAMKAAPPASRNVRLSAEPTPFTRPLDVDDANQIVAATAIGGGGAAAVDVADICRGITKLMDSRDVNVAVVNVDAHNNVDDSSSSNKNISNNNSSEPADDVARHGNTKKNNDSNSNKLVVDNAKSLDNNNYSTTHTEELSESKVLSTVTTVPTTTTTTELMTLTTSTMGLATTTTTSKSSSTSTAAAAAETSRNDNHKITNYEIHQPQTPSAAAEPHLARPFDGTSSGNRTPEQKATTNFIAAIVAGEEGQRQQQQCELASPRCQSRESNASGIGGDVRCPSNDSQCSGNDYVTSAPTPASPPVGLPLSATLAPAAAAALLPQQSAAMAAYFNAAAVAAQQNHLLLTNPLAAAASLVQHATQSHSPQSIRLTSSSSPGGVPDSSILDFSTKRNRRVSDHCSDGEVEEERNDNGSNDIVPDDLNSPLDLSVSAGRKRQSFDEGHALQKRKNPRTNDFKPLPPGTWVPPINPYLAAVAAANLSPKAPVTLDWNGKQQKMLPNEATKALEKMTEMTRLGSATDTEMPVRQVSTTSAISANSSNGRHSAWQSHWLNKGADAVKDVFKCVWCKQSFPTLASLTTHMKETQHCGVNVPPTVAAAVSAPMPTSNSGNQTAQSSHHSRHSSTQSVANNTSGTISTSSNKSDLNLLIKETMPLPRKLVRGQDVWLGKGAEQTRQILKCMWCGQSFRSLAEMTSHMQETQHYTNIISQEQIISWKSSDDKSSSGGSSNGTATSPAVTSPPSAANPTAPPPAASVTTSSNSTVSAVLTCKVCDQAFTSLKELSNHMVKNSHYKEHMMRSGCDNTTNVPKRGRQAREKRKKSLPVRKLLELERAQQDFKGNNLDPALKPLRDFAASTKITCEKCGDKIETALFVDHIRQCLGGDILMSPRHNNLKAPYATPVTTDRLISPQTPSSHSDGRKTAENNSSPITSRPDILCPMPKDGDKSSSTPSVLNAIEQLIEKSFDTRSRHGNSYGGGNHANTPLGSSILKRLGIDDSVDYTKPLIDPQTMNFLRSYSSYSGRDRSASESSSVSERCSSRLESVTPERNSEFSRQATPRLTPEKVYPAMTEAINLHKEPNEIVTIKSEPSDISGGGEIQLTENHSNEISHKISVKKEFAMANDDDDVMALRATAKQHEIRRKSQTPASQAISPSVSERSLTPKSISSLSEKKMPSIGSSLNALSSMFDNLHNMNTATNHGHTNITTNNATTGETNNNNITGKKSNANPLAALQKLCETTDPPAANTRSANNMPSANVHANAATPSNCGGGGGDAGNMVAFSWACNDAVMNSDSIIKCSFCDTPFCSKGAYRHHLSKVHFVKSAACDEADTQSSNVMKSPGWGAPSPKSVAAASPKSASKSPAAYRPQANSPATAPTPPIINPYDESPQSKFLKYTELAKQLSSKNV